MSDDFPKPKTWDLSYSRVAIVAARFNQSLVDHLINKVENALFSYQLNQDHLVTERTPGSNEIPGACSILLNSAIDFDCIIALGVVIKGGTDHHHLVGQSTSFALQELSMERSLRRWRFL